MAGSTRDVVHAVVGLAVAASCSRANPAFGDSQDDGKTGDDDGATMASVDDDPTADDHSDATATSISSTTGRGDGPGSSGASGLDDATSDTLGATTGTVDCNQPKPAVFDVQAVDQNTGDPIDSACGAVVTWPGAVTVGGAPHEMTIAVCPDSSCSCAELAEPVTLTFVDLVPSPDEEIGGTLEPCVSLTISRRAEVNGCGVEWIAMDTLLGPASFPMYLASSAAEPSWSLAVPTAALGGPLDVCDIDDCGVETQPGEYELMIGDIGPIAPGATVAGEFDPYVGFAATYDITALFARIDDTCTQFLGWAAMHTR